ncbi:hypothetical protein AgCh_039427 [Apium graveolens]
MSRYNKSSLVVFYANLSIKENKEGRVIIGVEEIKEKKDTFMLVGRFMADKNINFQAMKNLLASIWRPKEGMEVHDIEGYKFSFIFYHIMDLRNVIDGGPGSFKQNMLIYKQVQELEDPHTVLLKEADVWVQIHDIPKGFVSENVPKVLTGDEIGRSRVVQREVMLQNMARFEEIVGKKIEQIRKMNHFDGWFVETDANNFTGVWRDHFRVRVSIPLDDLLKRREDIEKPYGAWMRADPKRRTYTMGNKWLRPGGAISANKGGEEEGAKSKDISVEIATDAHVKSGDDENNRPRGRLTNNENQRTKKGIHDKAMKAVISPFKIYTAVNMGNMDNNEIIFTDPKRRRTTQDGKSPVENMLTSPQEEENEMKDNIQTKQQNCKAYVIAHLYIRGFNSTQIRM